MRCSVPGTPAVRRARDRLRDPAAGEFSRKHQESIKRSSKCVSQCIKQYHVVSYGIHTVSACIMQILFDVSQKYHILYHIRITCVSHTIRYRSDSTRYIYDTFDIMMIHTVGYGVFTVSYPLDTFTIQNDTLMIQCLLCLSYLYSPSRPHCLLK